jgi:putative nucleotidyltransferase with HDIG domain
LPLQQEKEKSENLQNLQRQHEYLDRQLAAILRINTELSSSKEKKEILSDILDQAISLLKAESGSLMLLNEKSNALTIEAARGLSQEIIESTEIPLGSGIAGWVAMRGEPLLLIDGIRDSRFSAELIRRERIKDAVCVPLNIDSATIGVLSINNSLPGRNFTESDLGLLEAFANQAAIAIQKSRSLEEMHQAYIDTIAMAARTVDARDPYTYGHSRALRDYSLAIAGRLDYNSDRLEKLNIAALLHDIGKIAIPDAVLLKPGPLTEDEYEVIKTHPTLGARILEPVHFLKDSTVIVLHHHERYDGGGYPAGLKGEEIPEGARILAIADAFDAMSSLRSYRKPLPKETILKELVKQRGRQFDPFFLGIFLEAFTIEEGLSVRKRARESALEMISQGKGKISLFDLAVYPEVVDIEAVKLIIQKITQHVLQGSRSFAGDRLFQQVEDRLNAISVQGGLPYRLKNAQMEIFVDDSRGVVELVKTFEGFHSQMQSIILQIIGYKLGDRLIAESFGVLQGEEKSLYSRLFQ